MREIKFRAYWKGVNQMRYFVPGHFVDTKDGWAMSFVMEDGNENIFLGKAEIMQCIGLKDKNGKDIYEGDIGEIRTQSGRVEKFVVEWGIHRREMASGWAVDIPGFCFKIDGFASFPIANNYLNCHDLDIIEIIGNIYENADLVPNAQANNTTNDD